MSDMTLIFFLFLLNINLIYAKAQCEITVSFDRIARSPIFINSVDMKRHIFLDIRVDWRC